MPGVSVLDRPPVELEEPWAGIWRALHKQLVEQGTWDRAQRPLLSECVFAFQAADVARLQEKPQVWDQHVKRASALMDQLALTVRARKQGGVKRDGEDEDDQGGPLAKLYEFQKANSA